MTNREEIEKHLGSLERVHLIAFSAGCVERMKPILQRVARAETRELCQDYLDLVWQWAAGHEVTLDVQKAQRRLQHLRDIRDCDGEYDSPLYGVVHIVGVLYYALNCGSSNEVVSDAKFALGHALEMCRVCDYEFARLTTDQAAGESAGPIEAREHQSGLNVAKLLAASPNLTGDILARIRAMCQEHASKFDEDFAKFLTVRFGRSSWAR